MGLNSRFLLHHQSRISYLEGGRGRTILLCFHGYGENAASFSFLEKHLGEHYHILSIDLPFHGETDWKEGNLTLSSWNELIRKILEQSGWKEGQPITLLGYSLGGRVALQYYHDQPRLINKILLLAPDGLKVNFWYWLSTQTLPGNLLFKFVMNYPGFFLGILKFLNRFGWINSSIYKFVHYYIGSPRVRQDLYKRWTTLKRIRPDLSAIQEQLRNDPIPVTLVYGRHDRIILPNRGYRFQQAVGDNCHLEVIESGHQVLHEKHIDALLPLLLP